MASTEEETNQDECIEMVLSFDGSDGGESGCNTTTASQSIGGSIGKNVSSDPTLSEDNRSEASTIDLMVPSNLSEGCKSESESESQGGNAGPTTLTWLKIRKRPLFVSLTITLLVAGILAIVLPLTRSKPGPNLSNPPETQGNTTIGGGILSFYDPSTCEILYNSNDDIESFRQNLFSVSPSTEQALEYPWSPQSKAYEWIKDNDKIACFSLTSQIQRFVLAALFFGTQDDALYDSSVGPWIDNMTSECLWKRVKSQGEWGEWYGVDCHDSGDIAKIQLQTSPIVNYTIPSELSLLTNLNSIWILGGGGISGLNPTLPNELGLLQELTSLSLLGMNIDGTIPDEWAALTKLQKMDVLLSSKGHGTIPAAFGSMSDLQFLSLDADLVGSIPTELARLDKLEILQLSGHTDRNAGLVGAIPSELFRLPNLRKFALNLNRLGTTIPSEVGLATNLETLRLFESQISGELPSEVGLLSSLVALELSQYGCYGDGFPGWLSINATSDGTGEDDCARDYSLTGPLVKELGNLSQLYSLRLANQGFLVPFPWIGAG